MAALPLYDRYSGTAALPRVELAVLPTPFEDIAPSAAGIDVGRLRVKRDDLTSPVYGGNKVRKLEFLLGQALAENARAVITFGAYGSNHALATAVHARACGLEPHVVLSPQAPGPFARATLLAHAGLGSVIHVVEGWDGSREAVRVRAMLRERDGIEPLVIPMGGTNAVGATGYVNAALEIAAADASAPDLVYVAGGTLGTAVGLATGFAAAGLGTRVVSVRVTPGEVANQARARELCARTVDLLHSLSPDFPALAFDDLALTMRDDWFEPGYGVVTPETLEAVSVAGELGLALETTYTGKAFAALRDDAARGELRGYDVAFLQTYSVAPPPAAGRVEALPRVLREYVAECDRLFGTPTPMDPGQR